MIWSEHQQRYIVVRESSINWTGPVAFLKGASGDQTEIAKQQKSFYSTLQNDYGTQFANQSNILNSLNKSLSPIVNAGVGQYGYGNAEDAAMRTQATAGTAGAYQSAKRAIGEQQAAQGGGDQFLASGVKQQQNAQLASSAAAQEAGQQLGITKSGYETGRNNFLGAVGEMQNVANAYNPSGYAGLANSAGTSAYGSAQQNQTMNIAGSPWSIAGGVLGGAIGAAEQTAGIKGATPQGASAWDPSFTAANSPGSPGGAPMQTQYDDSSSWGNIE